MKKRYYLLLCLLGIFCFATSQTEAAPRLSFTDYPVYENLVTGNYIFEEMNATTLATGSDVIIHIESREILTDGTEIEQNLPDTASNSFEGYWSFDIPGPDLKEVFLELTFSKQVTSSSGTSYIPTSVNTAAFALYVQDVLEVGGPGPVRITLFLESGRTISIGNMGYLSLFGLEQYSDPEAQVTENDIIMWYGGQPELQLTPFEVCYGSPFSYICYINWHISSYDDPITKIIYSAEAGIAYGAASLRAESFAYGESYDSPAWSGPDTDGDLIPDIIDNCPTDSNYDQLDTDNDGIGDACEQDTDGDGIPDKHDNCPVSPNDQQDVDGDGIGDACDPDIDADGVFNDNDNCPTVTNADQRDVNGNGIGDVCEPGECGGVSDRDNDCIFVFLDNCPNTFNPDQTDSDGDGYGNACDEDMDGDGILDIEDADMDGDGIINTDDEDMDGDGIVNTDDEDMDGDGLINDRDDDMDGDGIINTEDEDFDGDGIVNTDDEDMDGDGIFNWLDRDYDGDYTVYHYHYPSMHYDEDMDGDGIVNTDDEDMDGDGILNTSDNCINWWNKDQLDSDNNGRGDACEDRDLDGIHNSQDNCDMYNPDQSDSDNDGIGDVCDDDNDGDGVRDRYPWDPDNCPTLANPEQIDTCLLSPAGDACDSDIDGDGIFDACDNCPDVSNSDQANLDYDLRGDACDPDDDNDGISDTTDNCPTIWNADQFDSDGDGIGDACDSSPGLIPNPPTNVQIEITPGTINKVHMTWVQPTHYTNGTPLHINFLKSNFVLISRTPGVSHSPGGYESAISFGIANDVYFDREPGIWYFAAFVGDINDTYSGPSNEVSIEIVSPCTDNDGDGYGIGSNLSGCIYPQADCDDANAAVNPGASEVCDSIDNNCDGSVDEGFDEDNDGFTICGGDCNDSNATVHPMDYETDCFDGLDNDCNGAVDSMDNACIEVPTLPGSNVEVNPIDSTSGQAFTTITFDVVEGEGTTSVTSGDTSNSDLPAGFKVGDPPLFLEIESTVDSNGPIQICVDFSEFYFEHLSLVRLFHLIDGEWQDITDDGYPDLDKQEVCGTVTELSPFVILQANTPPDVGPITATVSSDPADNSVEVEADFTDIDTTDTHTAVWDWGDGNTSIEFVDEASGNGTVTGNHTYASCGTYTITLTVTDSYGGQGTSIQGIFVDTVPPEISLTVSQDTLWPPNHKMVPITVDVIVWDTCDPNPEFDLKYIIMNEGDFTNTFDPYYDDGIGDGNTTNDIQVDENGSISLRAERSGKSDGRIYTIIYEAADASGNSATANTTVTVPHDQGK